MTTYDPLSETIVIPAVGHTYNRFQVALDIQNASNPSGVARELVKVILDAIHDPAYTGTKFVRGDVAVRMVANKLSDLTRAESVWQEAGLTCEKLAAERAVQIAGKAP